MEERNAMAVRAVEYTAVKVGIRCGKCVLTKAGMSTLVMAMPARATIEKTMNPAVPPMKARTISPRLRATIATSMVTCSPHLRDSMGVMRPTRAKMRVGRLVRKPAMASDMCRLS